AGPQTRRGIKVLDHLEIIDVDVDRMLVVVVIDEPPLLDRVEPALNQRHVGECAAIERIHECFRVVGARHVVEKSAGDQDLPLNVRCRAGKVDKGGIGPKRLAFDEGGCNAGSLRGRGFRQHLRREDEESVGIADGGRQDAQASYYGWRIIRSIVGVEHAGGVDRLCTASALRYLQNEFAFGRYARRAADIAEAFYTLDRSRIQGLLLLSSPLIAGNPQLVADLTIRRNLPTISLFPDIA